MSPKGRIIRATSFHKGQEESREKGREISEQIAKSLYSHHAQRLAQISTFLSQPASVAQRWAKDGMPLKRQGRFVTATPEDLNKWLGREVGGEPVQVATADLDLSKELRRGLAFVRQQNKR